MTLLKRLFKKKPAVAPRSADYNFVEIHASQLDDYKDGITKIKNREIDGFLVRNVFSKEEVDKITKAFLATPIEERRKINDWLYFLPQAFAQLDQNSHNSRELLKEYYQEAERFWKEFPERFGVDFVGRIKDTLAKIGDGRAIEIPKGVDGEGIYNPATIKELKPGKGELKAHCGNLFHKEFPTFFGHLMETSVIHNQMSYFIMLSPPESGGELTLYDIEWDNVQKRLHGDTVLEDMQGNTYDLLDERQVTRKKLAPGPGDMITFAGGQIWHKVEFIEGSKSRFTIGGFMSRSKDDKTLYVWS